MLLTIKILMIIYVLSFVIFLYKLNNIMSWKIMNPDSFKLTYETNQLDINYGHISPMYVNYYFKLMNKKPNLEYLPSLISLSYIYNKKETLQEENIKSDFIKQIMQLKKLSIIIALLVFLIVSIEWNNLDVFTSAYQKGFILTLPLNISSGVILAYDHLSIPFILLLSFIFPIVFISNWTTVKTGEMKYYLSTILASHYFLIIVFLVIDILMFYVSFEIILPFFFILLGMFGGVQKFRAMYYLFLYTLWGSLFMLIEFLTKISENGTGVMGLLEDLQLASSWSIVGAIAIILAFSVKTPIVPFHLWLPLAHGDANVSGSIVLASIVLKMALYGFIRILIFILILSFATTQINMFFIFIFSLIFASTTTMRQNDLKVLVAYSSVAHMGSTLLGGFSNNHFGIFGSILFSIAHGVVSPALFIFVGAVFYDRIGSRIMNYLKGLVNFYPVAVPMLLTVIFGNMGTPLTANFIAELECILAAFMANPAMGTIAGLSIILSACYSIYMFNRITTGAQSVLLASAPDANKREFSILLPLVVLMVLLGIYPLIISEPIDLGLSHFLLGLHKNPFTCLLILASLLKNIKLNVIYTNIVNKLFSFNLAWKKMENIKILNFVYCRGWNTSGRYINSLNTMYNLSSLKKFGYLKGSKDSSNNGNNEIKLSAWWFFSCINCRKISGHERLDSSHPCSSGENRENPVVDTQVVVQPTPEEQYKIAEIMGWMNWQMKIMTSRGGGGVEFAQNLVEEAHKRAIKQGLDPKWLGLRAPSDRPVIISKTGDLHTIKGSVSAERRQSDRIKGNSSTETIEPSISKGSTSTESIQPSTSKILDKGKAPLSSKTEDEDFIDKSYKGKGKEPAGSYNQKVDIIETRKTSETRSIDSISSKGEGSTSKCTILEEIKPGLNQINSNEFDEIMVYMPTGILSGLLYGVHSYDSENPYNNPDDNDNNIINILDNSFNLIVSLLSFIGYSSCLAIILTIYSLYTQRYILIPYLKDKLIELIFGYREEYKKSILVNKYNSKGNIILSMNMYPYPKKNPVLNIPKQGPIVDEENQATPRVPYNSPVNSPPNSPKAKPKNKSSSGYDNNGASDSTRTTEKSTSR